MDNSWKTTIIKEYIPKGLVSLRLFPLNSQRVYPVMSYWAEGISVRTTS